MKKHAITWGFLTLLVGMGKQSGYGKTEWYEMGEEDHFCGAQVIMRNAIIDTFVFR